MLKQKTEAKIGFLRIARQGQSVSEYTLLLAIVLVAIISMHIYVKRGLQGRYADEADSLWIGVKQVVNAQVAKGEKTPAEAVKLLKYPQYEPYYLDSENKVNAPRKIQEKMITGGTASRHVLSVVDDKNVPIPTVVSSRTEEKGLPD